MYAYSWFIEQLIHPNKNFEYFLSNVSNFGYFLARYTNLKNPSLIINHSDKSCTMSGKNLSDKELKEQGNKLFAARNYDAAIECYTKALMKNPSIPHYYTNRALCYLNQKRWPLAIQDAKQALEKDPNSVKGHFYLGNYL